MPPDKVLEQTLACLRKTRRRLLSSEWEDEIAGRTPEEKEARRRRSQRFKKRCSLWKIPSLPTFATSSEKMKTISLRAQINLMKHWQICRM